jgi:hypothetical protein
MTSITMNCFTADCQLAPLPDERLGDRRIHDDDDGDPDRRLEGRRVDPGQHPPEDDRDQRDERRLLDELAVEQTLGQASPLAFDRGRVDRALTPVGVEGQSVVGGR